MNTKRIAAAEGVILAALKTRQTAAGVAIALESACLLQSPETAAELAKLRSDLEEMTCCRDNALRALYRDDVETDVDLEETVAAPFYGPGWDWDEAALMRVVREAVAAIRPAFAKLTEERDGLRAERHSTNEALSDAAEQLRVQRDRIAELEALTPAPIQTCRICGAGYTLGQPCSSCEFQTRMAAELRRIEAERPEAGFSHRCGIPLVQRLDCGHCPHEVCQDCERCPHFCQCGTPPRQAEDPHDSPLHHDYALGRDLPTTHPTDAGSAL